MLSAPLSFFNKLETVQVNFEFDPEPQLTASAIISENGYEAVPVHFVLRPRTRELPTASIKRASCFELVKQLVKNSQTGVSLDKESLNTILTRNVQLAEELKHTSSFIDKEMVNFEANERELLVSLDEGISHFEIPTFDFAITGNEGILFVCTALTSQERVFFQISNYPTVLEQVLRVFMIPPRSDSHQSGLFSLPILPTIGTEHLVIQPASVFEEFFDDSTSDNENNNNTESENVDPIVLNHHQQQQQQQQQRQSKPKRSESVTKPASIQNRKCLNCFCTSTPMWRRGPDGTASLCNACGVKFKAGKLQLSPETIEENMKIVRQYVESMQIL